MPRMRLVAALLVVFLLLALQIPAGAGPGQAPAFGRFLVGLRPGVSAAALAGPDVRVTYDWPDLSAAAVQATPAGQARLAAHRGVAYVEPDVLRYPTAQSEITWGLDDVNAPDVWGTTTGAGIGVCIIDSGIDYGHPEFFRNGVSIVKDSANFVGDGHATAADGLGHGTHVAGTIAAQVSGSGVAGVAHGADLYIARIFDDAGGGAYTSVIVNAVNWCKTRAHVFNMSYGGSLRSRTEESAYNDAYNNYGRLLIAASGNDGGRISYPAKYDSVVAVGALTRLNTLASFSNYGAEQELAAPGVGILSTVPRGTGLMGTASEDGVSYEAYALEYSGTTSGVSGPLVECGLADSATSCTGEPSTGAWIAMVDRGTVTFADKVTNVMAQGASAAMIANNDTASPDDPGSFTLGAAGNWIPTVSVSYESGQTVRSNGLGSGTVTVGVSDYAYYDGTSMASPHAVGVAALTWAVNKNLKNTDVRSILQQTALDLGAAGRDDLFGYGLVQADRAVAAAGGGGGTTGGTLTGTVTDTGNNPIANATVSVDGTAYSGTTDGNGSYTITGVPAGTYSVTASATGYNSQQVTDVGISDGGTTPQNFQLTAAGGGGTGSMNVAVDAGGPYTRGSFVYIKVTVTDANTGSGLAGATVSLSITDPDNALVATGSGTTGSDGAITFRWRSSKTGKIGWYTATANVTLTGYGNASGSDTFEMN